MKLLTDGLPRLLLNAEYFSIREFPQMQIILAAARDCKVTQ